MTEFSPQIDAVFIGVGVSGVTHYRSMLPARQLGASMYVRVAELDKMKLVGDLNASVVVYSMPRSKEMIEECMQILADPKRRLVIDIDDSLRAIVEDGTHAVAAEWAGLVDQHEWLLARADAVTCTTQFLADYAQHCGQSNVHVVPNALDIERWNHKREPRHKEFTIIGWSGSGGHEAALEAHAPALADLLRRRGDIAFASVGRPLSQYFPDDLKHRFHDAPFMPLAKHPMVLTQFHINIGPTLATDFYRAKSDLRALEAFASDSTFIGGSTTYMDTMVEAEAGWACSDGDGSSLVNAIELVLDASGKDRMRDRKNGLAYVRENRLIEHTAPLWQQAIMSVMP